MKPFLFAKEAALKDDLALKVAFDIINKNWEVQELLAIIFSKNISFIWEIQ